MHTSKLWLQFVYDLKNIKRDIVLLVSLLAPLILTILLKAGIPFLGRFSLDEYVPLALVIGLLVTPFTVGLLAGFLILDERDEQILSYLSITPVTKAQFIVYRLSFPIVICFLSASLMFVLNAWRPFSVTDIITFTVLSLEAPIVVLIMAVFAQNKVEGLAIGKVISISIVAPVIGFFFDTAWRWIGLLFPPFWVAETLFTESFFLQLIILSGAFIYHISLILWLIKKLEKRIG